MDDFAYRPFVKQVGPGGRDVPPSAVVAVVEKEGQPASEVGHIVVDVEVTPNGSSSVLAKRKRGNCAEPFDYKKSKAIISIHALK